MSHNLAFDFIVNKEENTITVKREFDANRALVWEAYTTPEILEQWWAPKPWKAKTKSMNFTEGGSWIYAMIGPNGEEHWAIMNYKTIKIHEQYAGSDAFSDENGVINLEMPQTDCVVDFSDIGNRTMVNFHLVYGDLAQLEATIQMGFKEGLSMAMENLDAWLTENR